MIENLQLASHLANMGMRAPSCYPASTTHRQLTAEQLVAGGVSPTSSASPVGLEDVEDPHLGPRPGDHRGDRPQQGGQA